MKYTPFFFSSRDNLTFQGRAWLTQQVYPNGIVHLLHDLGGHSAGFSYVGERIAEAGYHFFAFDLRGHGLSEGKRGNAPSYTHLMNDIEKFLQITTNQFHNNHPPKILYGHGLGGNLAINYILRRQPDVSALITTNPMLATKNSPSPLRISLLKLIANILPGFRFNNHINSNHLARDPAVVKAYQADIYNHDHISARLALQIYQGGRYALKNAHQWNIPLLLIQGTDDSISSVSISQTFAEKAGTMVDLVLLEGAYHDIHNDFDNDLVINKMINWLDKEIK